MPRLADICHPRRRPGTGRLTLAIATLPLLCGAVPAIAATITAKSQEPAYGTEPLVDRTEDVRVKKKATRANPYAVSPSTKYRVRVFPDTYGFKPTSTACQGRYTTPANRSRGVQLPGRSIVVDLRKRWCKGIRYRGVLLVGARGSVSDGVFMFCVRGRQTPTTQSCGDRR